MFDVESHLIKLLDSERKPTLYFSEASTDANARMFFAADKASSFARVVLVGKEGEIRSKALNSPLCESYASEAALSVSEYINYVTEKVVIVDPEDPKRDEQRKIYAKHCHAKLGHKSGLAEQDYYNWLQSPIAFSILSATDVPGYGKDGHCVFGGLTVSSRDFFLPCLKLHPRNGTVFTAALFTLQKTSIPGIHQNDMVVFADVAVVSEMDENRLADITFGSAEMAHDLLFPNPCEKINVAMLSYSTRGSGAGTSVNLVREAHKIVMDRIASCEHNKFDDINITPELQFAPAVLEKAAMQKLNLTQPINKAAGNANVLIAPSLDVGNILFHLHVAYFKGASYVLIPIGFSENSAVDFSRSSKVKDVVLASAASCVRLQKMNGFNHQTNL